MSICKCGKEHGVYKTCPVCEHNGGEDWSIFKPVTSNPFLAMLRNVGNIICECGNLKPARASECEKCNG